MTTYCGRTRRVTIRWVVISSRRYSPDIQLYRNPPAGCGGQPPLAGDAGPGPEGKIRRRPGMSPA